MAVLLPEGRQSFTDSAGVPLVGGRLYTYAAGTSSPKVTYADASNITPNTNPIILDGRGEATIFWSGAYKVVLRDASDVVVWTVDNVTTVPEGGSAADLTARLANNLLAADNVGMIGFNPTLSYAAGTLGKDLLNDAINPHNYPWLVKGDGVTDDSVAINNVMTFAAGRPVLFEDRTYVCTAQQIEANDQTTTGAYRAGAKVFGQGIGKTKFINRTGLPLFKHTLTQTQGDNNYFARGVQFADFEIINDGSSPAGSGGFSMQGAMLPKFSRIKCEGLSGDGWATPVDARWANPDRYSCGILLLEQCISSGNVGCGVNGTAFSNTYHLVDCVMNANTLSGVYAVGTGHLVSGGAYAGNNTSLNASHGGLIFAHSANGPSQVVTLCGAPEIDSNRVTQLWFQGYNCTADNCRFIDDATTGSFYSADQVKIGGISGATADNNQIVQPVFRLSNGGAANAAVTNLVGIKLPVTDGSQAARYNVLDNPSIAQSGAATGTVTRMAVQNSTDNDVAGNKYFINDQLQYASSANQSTDRAAASVALGANFIIPVSPASAAVLTANSIVYDTHNAYDNVAYHFTAPYTGLLRLGLNLLVTSGAANQQITIQFQRSVGGGGFSTLSQVMTIRDGNGGTFSGFTTLQVAAADRIRVLGVQVAGGTAVFAASSGSSSISYEMM